MKKVLVSLACLAMTAALAFPAPARQWQQAQGGIRWVDDDGEWLRDTWEWIDDDWDGTAECYYFDSDGYRAENGRTPDNYTVNERGQWTENGIVQTKNVGAAPSVYIQPIGSNVRPEVISETINLTDSSDSTASCLPPDRLRADKYDGFKWVVSTKNKKYHIIGCGDVKSIPDGCRYYADDSNYLKHMGFRACEKCTGKVKD